MLDARQWVAFSGLDPRLFKSGKSVEKRPRISRGGSRHLRSCSLHASAGRSASRSLSATLLSKLTALAAKLGLRTSRRSGYAKAAACSVCHVPHQSSPVRRSSKLCCAVDMLAHAIVCLCLTDPKKREVLLHLSREKKIEFQERIASIIIMFGSFFLEPFGWLGTTKVYSGMGADIVMESITLKTSARTRRAPAAFPSRALRIENADPAQQHRRHVRCQHKTLAPAVQPQPWILDARHTGRAGPTSTRAGQQAAAASRPNSGMAPPARTP